MNSITLFLFFIPTLGLILLGINLVFAPHNPYQEKSSTFECGFHSFLGQNRMQFTISFFVFALLFLVFDLELVLALPGLISMSSITEYGISIMIIFFAILTIGFVFELGKDALKIDSRQYNNILQSSYYIFHTNYYIFTKDFWTFIVVYFTIGLILFNIKPCYQLYIEWFVIITIYLVYTWVCYIYSKEYIKFYVIKFKNLIFFCLYLFVVLCFISLSIFCFLKSFTINPNIGNTIMFNDFGENIVYITMSDIIGSVKSPTGGPSGWGPGGPGSGPPVIRSICVVSAMQMQANHQILGASHVQYALALQHDHNQVLLDIGDVPRDAHLHVMWERNEPGASLQHHMGEMRTYLANNDKYDIRTHAINITPRHPDYNAWWNQGRAIKRLVITSTTLRDINNGIIANGGQLIRELPNNNV